MLFIVLVCIFCYVLTYKKVLNVKTPTSSLHESKIQLAYAHIYRPLMQQKTPPACEEEQAH